MNLIPAKCTSCGGVLSVDETKEAAVCPYCGNAFIVEKAIQSFSATYVINNIKADTVIMNSGNIDFDISAGTLIRYKGAEITVTIPDTVDRIAPGAFFGLNIQSVIIPSTVESIGAKAFFDCKRLNNITFNNGLREIGSEAFGNCTSLQKVELPDSIVSIDTFAFRYCDNLKTIRLSSHASSVASNAFVGVIIDKFIIPDDISAESLAIWLDIFRTIDRDNTETTENVLNSIAIAKTDFWKSCGVCAHCGGVFEGIFKQKCSVCGKPKDY